MAKMNRCPQGHFFDRDKHDSCPWCSVSQDRSPDDKTKRVQTGSPPPPPAPQQPSPQAPVSANKTKRLDQTGQGVRPVVGWLVCAGGPDKGSDFRLHAEKNFLGRDPSMDVCIARDESVSRLKHAVVIFDPKKKQFWLQPGESEGLVYLNDELVSSPTPVTADCVIEIGHSRLVVVPFDSSRYDSE